MINKREKGFFISFAIILIALLVFAVTSVVLSAIVVTKENSFLNNVFEIIYLGVHFMITFFALVLAFKAVRDGSWVMKNLMYMKDHDWIRSKMAGYIALTVAIINFILLVYSSLMVFNVAPGFSSFPLKLDLVNVSLTVFIVALYFYLYPFVMDAKKGDK